MITVKSREGTAVLRVHRWPNDPGRISVVLDKSQEPLNHLQGIFEVGDILEMARRIVADLEEGVRVSGDTL